jgi:putative addiction module component (TIGR02574 family)
MTLPKVDIESLSADERLALIERIWNSLTSDDVGPSRAQHDELARRLDDVEQNPGAAISWAEAQRRIRERKR